MAEAKRRHPPRRYGGERSRRHNDRLQPPREARERSDRAERGRLEAVLGALTFDNYHYGCNRFALMNSSGVLKALKNRGVPANESGDTGPMVMNEYSRVAMSKEEWGSRKS